MNILIVHNKYKLRGGEERVVENEEKLLSSHGNTVHIYTRDNRELETYSIIKKIKLSLEIIYSFKTIKDINHILKHNKIDIIHIHNLFPIISPSILYLAKKHKIPVLLTLHNFRLVGGNPFLMRKGKINEDSLRNRNPFLEVRYKSYNNSYIATFFLALSLWINKKAFLNYIDKYIALTEFAKKKFIEGGFPENKIEVRPSSLGEFKNMNVKRKLKAIYVGRIAKEKGIKTLINAWKGLNYPLEIYGEGKTKVKSERNIKIMGLKPINEIKKAMSESAFVIIPSEWYENLPNVLLESYSAGTPVLTSDSENLKNLVEKPKAGLTFKMGNSLDLTEKAVYLFKNNKPREKLGKNAFKEYLREYKPQRGYESLIKIYKKVINENNHKK
ncbi:MAG: glycosyltransferase family 4 protein [Nanoarchaeota archaeon]